MLHIWNLINNEIFLKFNGFSFADAPSICCNLLKKLYILIEIYQLIICFLFLLHKMKEKNERN